MSGVFLSLSRNHAKYGNSDGRLYKYYDNSLLQQRTLYVDLKQFFRKKRRRTRVRRHRRQRYDQLARYP